MSIQDEIQSATFGEACYDHVSAIAARADAQIEDLQRRLADAEAAEWAHRDDLCRATGLPRRGNLATVIAHVAEMHTAMREVLLGGRESPYSTLGLVEDVVSRRAPTASCEIYALLLGGGRVRYFQNKTTAMDAAPKAPAWSGILSMDAVALDGQWYLVDRPVNVED